jgi:ATP-binding cassette, subfamily B, bacterial PglK
VQILLGLKRILTPRDRAVALALLAGLFVGALLETAGIGLVLPFLAILGDPSLITRRAELAFLHGRINEASPGTVFGILSVGLLGFFFLKNLFLAALTWWQLRFLRRQQQLVATRILEGYLSRPYEFFLQHNSSVLIRTVNYDVQVAFSQVLVPFATLLVESSVCVCIVALLLVMAPITTLTAMLFLGGGAFLFLRASHRQMEHYAQATYTTGQAMEQATDQALGGIKETKILGRERFWTEMFSRQALLNLRAAYRASVFANLPRLAIETLAVAGMVLVGVVSVWQRGDVRRVLPLLGLFAVAAVRLMPSVNRMLLSLATIRSGLPAFEVVSSEGRDAAALRSPEARPSVEPLPFRAEIVLRSVTFAYSGAPAPTLADLSLTIKRGQSVAIVGPSGAGKTTLVDVLLGLLPPSHGEILIDGLSIQPTIEAWQRNIGYVPQTVFLADDTIRRNVAFGLPDSEISDELVSAALRAARLSEFVASQPEGLDAQVGENGVRLSGGQRQRIGIARALYLNPPVLVLDEATSSLDGPTENEIRETVLALAGHKTILVVAHRLASVRQCDVVYFLVAGRVAASGPFDALYSRDALFRAFASSSLISEADESSRRPGATAWTETTP